MLGLVRVCGVGRVLLLVGYGGPTGHQPHQDPHKTETVRDAWLWHRSGWLSSRDGIKASTAVQTTFATSGSSARIMMPPPVGVSFLHSVSNPRNLLNWWISPPGHTPHSLPTRALAVLKRPACLTAP